jgi:hypothetical protein
MSEIRAGNACDEHGRRVLGEPADLENAFGIVARCAARLQHVLIAGAFAFLDQSSLEPPHERVKPEHCLDSHVQRGCEVVVMLDMTLFMRDQRTQLGRRESIANAVRHQQHRAPDPEYPRFNHRGRCEHREAQVLTDIDRPRVAERSPDRLPLPPPLRQYQSDTTGPGANEQRPRQR